MNRRRQAKWDAGNMRTVSTKMPRKEWSEFRAVCLAENVTPYALALRLLREWRSRKER